MQTPTTPSPTPSRGDGSWWRLCRFSAHDIQRNPAVWLGAARALLAEAFEHCDSTPAEMGAEVAKGNMQLWTIYQPTCAPSGAVVTQLNETVRGKECLILLLGGKGMDKWLHLLGDIERWAKAQGCAAMCVMGRKGWKRVLKDYDETGVILAKEL